MIQLSQSFLTLLEKYGSHQDFLIAFLLKNQKPCVQNGGKATFCFLLENA